MDHKTIEAYNKIARDYDQETADFWDEYPRTFLEKFIELSGNKIVDIGSGPGRDGLIFQQAGKDVTCVDGSETMIKLSSEKGLKSILADFNHLPLQDESFDGVWSYTSLLHIPKSSINKSLTEISRVLKSSGFFALGLIQGDTEEYKENSDDGTSRLFSFYQKDEVIDLCKKYGFELVYFEIFKPRLKNYLNFIFYKP